MPKRLIDTQQSSPVTIALCVQAPYHRKINFESYSKEFENLIRTNRIAADFFETVKLRSIDPSSFLTKGKLANLKQLVDEHKIKELIISEPLTTRQQRNLSQYLNCLVFDRTQLILEIFEKAAKSAEGKLQVKIAVLEHAKSRLAGKGVHLAQQAGQIGVRGGPGETLKERDTRLIEQTIFKLKKQLERLAQSRQTRRKQRLESGVPHICLIGYTNAGKSTILNALTQSNVLAEDKLFATLDTTTRELYVGPEKIGIMTDTVGFIQNLPHQLIAAFKSTLSELQYADLLLHVVDCSDPNVLEHIQTVNSILEDLSIEKPVLYVLNKTDQVAHSQQLETITQQYAPYVLTSATTENGLEALRAKLLEWSQSRQQ